MSELISRKTAIDLIEEMKPYHQDADDIAEMIANMPSAQLERKKGKWIKKYRGNYLCSVCGAWYRTTDEYGNIIDGEMRAKYCEECGAKMDLEEYE